MTTYILIDEFGDAFKITELTPEICKHINEGCFQTVLVLKNDKLQVREYVCNNSNEEPMYKYADIADLDM